MMKRLFNIVFLTVFVCLMIYFPLDQYVIRSVWAQAIQPTIPINFTGGTNCTVLIPAVTGQRVYLQNGQVVLPAIGTGLTFTFIGTTSGGFVPGLPGAGTTCGPSGVNLTLTVLGTFVGPQAGSTTLNPAVYNLTNGSIITAQGQGLAVEVSGPTAGQPVAGFVTAIQQP